MTILGTFLFIVWTICAALVTWGLTKSAIKTPTTSYCKEPKDCPEPDFQDCINKECTYVCNKDRPCKDGYTCIDGRCVKSCNGADDATSCQDGNYECVKQNDEENSNFICKRIEGGAAQDQQPPPQPEQEEDYGNVWISYFLLSILIFVLPLIDFVNNYAIQTYLGNNWNKYFAHVWLCSIIGMYTSGIHHFMLGPLSSTTNMIITAVFSVGTFIFSHYISSNYTFYLFKEIYSFFEYLFLSKQQSIINAILFVIWAIFAYKIYTKERYSKDYNKEERHQCNWHMPDKEELENREENCNPAREKHGTCDSGDVDKDIECKANHKKLRSTYEKAETLEEASNLKSNDFKNYKAEGTSTMNRLVILLGWFVFIIYPFILYWRTYSLEGTVLVENRAPLIFFGIGMFILFIDLFFSGLRKFISKAIFTKKWRDSTKKMSMACVPDKTCKEVGVTDYPASIGFNYIIWMSIGLICQSGAISFSKNEAVKKRGIATTFQALKFFFQNMIITIFHCLSTIFGGTHVWTS
jgi:hypothetical protein